MPCTTKADISSMGHLLYYYTFFHLWVYKFDLVFGPSVNVNHITEFIPLKNNLIIIINLKNAIQTLGKWYTHQLYLLNHTKNLRMF